MEYRVLPGFLRRREQRLFGLVTPLQLVALFGSAMPLFLLSRVSLWLALPGLVGLGLAFYGMSPTEGTLHALVWLCRLRAVAARDIDASEAFTMEGPERALAPLVVYDEGGGVALAAEVAPVSRAGSADRRGA